MRVIHLLSCLSAVCLALGNTNLCLPVANAQQPVEEQANDGNTLHLRPSEDGMPSAGGQENAIQSIPVDPPIESPPTVAEQQPAERKAAVIFGRPVFLPKRIEDIKLDIRPQENVPIPPDTATPAFATVERDPSRDETWVLQQFMWQASEFWQSASFAVQDGNRSPV
jgi:hypothetical protein